MVTLKAVLHYEEMHTDECWICCLIRRLVVWLQNFTLANLIRALYFLNEGSIRVDAIALFEDDGVDLCKGILNALSLNLELRWVEVNHTFVTETHLTHLREALLYWLTLDSCQVLMRLPNILVGILRQESEVSCWDHFPEDWLGPLFTSLMLILDLEVLRDEPRRGLHNLNDLVLQD